MPFTYEKKTLKMSNSVLKIKKMRNKSFIFQLFLYETNFVLGKHYFRTLKKTQFAF